MRQKYIKVFLLLMVSFFTNFSVFSSHNSSRYFPFLERPENYILRNKSCAQASLFYTSAATAFKRGGGNAGIPELWGSYDLWNVLTSLEGTNKSPSFVSSIKSEIPTEYVGKSLRFKVDGKLKSRGVALSYDHNLKWNNLVVGMWVPFMSVSSTSKYSFDADALVEELKSGKLSSAQKHVLSLRMDSVRRRMHDEIGFKENDWEKNGIGDVDLYIRWSYFLDHQMMMRGINLGLQAGMIVPTGVKAKNNNPVSVSFMSDGHWGLYLDHICEFELKQNIKVGFMLSGLYQFKNKRERRISAFKEPANFSSIKGSVEVNPGVTAKLSPYLILENIRDGVSFQARYTYLRHDDDTWKDCRKDKTVSSYLTKKTGATDSEIAQNIFDKKNLTRSRMHYMTLQLDYNSKKALNNWVMDPNLYLLYDIPISGSGRCKTHQIALGVELHF